MSLVSSVRRIWTAQATSNTATLHDIAGQAAAVQLLYVTNGFTGTLDIQGSLSYDGTFVNLPYVTVGASMLDPAVAQISETTDTGSYHVIVLAPMPFMKLAMTRSAGSITLDARAISAPLMLGLAAPAA